MPSFLWFITTALLAYTAYKKYQRGSQPIGAQLVLVLLAGQLLSMLLDFPRLAMVFSFGWMLVIAALFALERQWQNKQKAQSSEKK